MNKKLFALIALFAIFLAACGAVPRSVSYNSGVAPAEQQSKSLGLPGGSTSANAPTVAGQTTNAYATDTQPTDSNRLVIKNADLSIYVDDPTQSMDRISKMAEDMGGFVVTANLTQTYLDNGLKVPHATVTVRVPAERLDEALTQIKAETTQPVINENVTSQDVTSQYTDLQSRLKNLQAAETQLQSIMAEATKTEDVLAVYNQLVSVREQIEVLQGQINYYEQSAALSAITVDLTANQASQPLKIAGWQPVGVVKNAIQILIRAFQGLVNIGIYLVLLVLPIMALVLLPPYLIIRGLLALRARRRAQKPAMPSSQV